MNKELTPKEKAMDLKEVFVDNETALTFCDWVIRDLTIFGPDEGEGDLYTELAYWNEVKHEIVKP